MPRRHLLALLAALTLASVPAAAHPVEQERLANVNVIEVERDVLAFRTALVEAIKAKDAAALRDMYTVNYTQTHASGRTDGRDARILQLLAGDPVVETAAVDDLAIRVFGPDTAVATGKSPIVSRDGSSYEVKWIAVYVRLAGIWKLASTQATKTPGSS